MAKKPAKKVAKKKASKKVLTRDERRKLAMNKKG